MLIRGIGSAKEVLSRELDIDYIIQAPRPSHHIDRTSGWDRPIVSKGQSGSLGTDPMHVNGDD